jgi:HEAT repeat protein
VGTFQSLAGAVIANGPSYFDGIAVISAWVGLALALSMCGAVVVARLACGWLALRSRQLERQYLPLIVRALAHDDAAVSALVAAPSRHQLIIAALLITPLIDDRDPSRVARTRTVVQAMSLVPVADRYLRSRLWWRRAIALRALGLLQLKDRTAAIVGALDDSNRNVRAAALDALSDLKDPASLQGVVVRLHDASLPLGRRIHALAAFGTQCEPFLLDLASVDRENRLGYAYALTICGTARARPTLCGWTCDERVAVRAASFEALAHVGLDHHAARLAIEALSSEDVLVRAMAARALSGWRDPGEAAARLGQHLDDVWTVAVEAARSLQTMSDAGVAVLITRAGRPDLAGLLARQMLWEVHVY